MTSIYIYHKERYLGKSLKKDFERRQNTRNNVTAQNLFGEIPQKRLEIKGVIIPVTLSQPNIYLGKSLKMTWKGVRIPETLSQSNYINLLTTLSSLNSLHPVSMTILLHQSNGHCQVEGAIMQGLPRGYQAQVNQLRMTLSRMFSAPISEILVFIKISHHFHKIKKTSLFLYHFQNLITLCTLAW